MPRGPAADTALAAQVWGLMFDYLLRTSPQRTRSLARHGLTPNDSRALFTLSADEGQTMRALATAWQCDPSNATWIVDRLEALGLVERRNVAEDRRVKLVMLTAKGRQTRAALERDFHSPPPELAALEHDDLDCLRRVLGKLMAAPGADPPK